MIEKIIVIVLIGILAALGFNAYLDSTTKAHSVDADQTLSRMRNEIIYERMWHSKYPNAIQESSKHYFYSGKSTANGFEVDAVPMTKGASKKKLVIIENNGKIDSEISEVP